MREEAREALVKKILDHEEDLKEHRKAIDMARAELENAKTQCVVEHERAVLEAADGRLTTQFLAEARESLRTEKEVNAAAQDQKQAQITKLAEKAARLQSCVDQAAEAAWTDAEALESARAANGESPTLFPAGLMPHSNEVVLV